MSDLGEKTNLGRRGGRGSLYGQHHGLAAVKLLTPWPCYPFGAQQRSFRRSKGFCAKLAQLQQGVTGFPQDEAVCKSRTPFMTFKPCHRAAFFLWDGSSCCVARRQHISSFIPPRSLGAKKLTPSSSYLVFTAEGKMGGQKRNLDRQRLLFLFCLFFGSMHFTPKTSKKELKTVPIPSNHRRQLARPL